MHRRPLLKAVGSASALPFVSGRSVAQTEAEGTGGSGDGGSDCSIPECIHPTLGYSGLTNDGDPPDGMEPDHEVMLRTEPRGDDEIPEFYFEPTGLYVGEGDIVRFTLESPDHTVTAYHPNMDRQRRVPSDVPPFSSPVLGEDTYWLYRFDQLGVYDILCAPHEIFGMVMRVVVEEPALDFGEEGRPPELTAALVYRDQALEPDTIVEEGTVSWEDIADENKRLLIELRDPEEASEDNGANGDGESS